MQGLKTDGYTAKPASVTQSGGVGKRDPIFLSSLWEPPWVLSSPSEMSLTLYDWSLSLASFHLSLMGLGGGVGVVAGGMLCFVYSAARMLVGGGKGGAEAISIFPEVVQEKSGGWFFRPMSPAISFF